MNAWENPIGCSEWIGKIPFSKRLTAKYFEGLAMCSSLQI